MIGVDLFFYLYFGAIGIALLAGLVWLWSTSAMYLHSIWCDNCKFERLAWEWKGRPAPESGAKCSTCGCRNTMRKRGAK